MKCRFSGAILALALCISSPGIAQVESRTSSRGDATNRMLHAQSGEVSATTSIRLELRDVDPEGGPHTTALRGPAARRAASPDAALVKRTWTVPRSASRAGTIPGMATPTSGNIAANGARAFPQYRYHTMNEHPEGDMPREVTYTPDGAQILVAHRDTDNVTFFDAVTLTATNTVDVGEFPVDVVVSPDGKYAVVPNVFGHSVSVIHLPTYTVAATIPVTGEQPFEVAVTPDSLFAVAAVITDGVTSRFSVIDLTTFTETLSFPSVPQGALGFFYNPECGISGNIFSQYALTPDGLMLVVPDRGGNQVVIYDRLTGAPLAQLPTASLPTAVDVSDDGAFAVVSHEGSANQISVIDLTTLTVSGTLATNDSLSGQAIRITPDKTHVIAAISNNVIFVNLTSGATTAKLSTGVVGDIEFSHDGKYAFVSNYNARIIDIASQTIVRTVTHAACEEAAASPTTYEAVALNNHFRENIHFYDIAGSAGHLNGYGPSGEPEEGDACYGLDISKDGRTAVVCNVVSENVTLYDFVHDRVRAYVHVGDRPKEVRITPDGKYAVVCAMDANAVRIIDLATDQVVKSLNIYNRPGRVRISPDSRYAYVLNVAGTDRITFIELAGAQSKILSQESAGQTGSANGYTYTETSGIELSPDGSILAVCDSFNDYLRLFDTSTRKQVAQVTVGDFPIRAAFSPNGKRIYVTNAFGDSLSVVEESGGAYGLIHTVPGIDFPLTVDVDPTGQYVYVGNAGNGAAIRVIDTSFWATVKTLSFGSGSPRDTHLDPVLGILYAASTDGELWRIQAAGQASTVLEKTPLAGGPADLAVSDLMRTAVLAQPVPDGMDVVSFWKDGELRPSFVIPK